MLTEAERIQRRNIREAYANGVADFAKHFGQILAALIFGAALGIFASWVAWLFYFATVTNWTVLVSPSAMAILEVGAFAAILGAWRLLRRRGPE